MTTTHLLTLEAQHDGAIKVLTKARRRLATAADDVASYEKREGEAARGVESLTEYANTVRQLCAARRRLKAAQEEVDQWERAEDRAARDVNTEAQARGMEDRFR